MLTAQELARQLLASASGRVPIDELEQWFDSNSWNVHKQRDQGLIDAVFHVEECFSAHADSRIDDAHLLRLFEEIARELRSHESPLLDEEYVLAETQDATRDFTPTGGVQKISSAAPPGSLNLRSPER